MSPWIGTDSRRKFFRGGVIQVAGVRDADEAAMLAMCGVDLLGWPLRLDVNEPDLSEDKAAAVIRGAGLGPRSVLITYESDPQEVVALARKLDAGWVQLHGPVDVDAAARLRELAPETGLIASLVVRGEAEELLARGRELSPHVDAFITDTFDPRTGASGATGRTHDWDVSAQLARGLKRPVILAGGLGPDNAADAVFRVRPAGVDAHTGLEDEAGRKDQCRVLAFVAAAREAFLRLGQPAPDSPSD